MVGACCVAAVVITSTVLICTLVDLCANRSSPRIANYKIHHHINFSKLNNNSNYSSIVDNTATARCHKHVIFDDKVRLPLTSNWNCRMRRVPRILISSAIRCVLILFMISLSLVTSIFLYACESWILTAQLLKRIPAMERYYTSHIKTISPSRKPVQDQRVFSPVVTPSG